MARIIDDTFVNITNDIEKVQAKPNMYISYVGQRAFLHLTKEMVNNVIDEDSNVNSISDGTCDIFYDQSENMFYIRDHGRGIAFDELENACTILQSGTKMTREHGNTGGENGVGLTATNALSEIFEITSYRYGEMLSIQFKEGKKISEKKIPLKKEEHGLQVAFKPSKLYLGNDLQLPIEEFKDWLAKLSYTVDSERLRFKLTVNYTGKEATTTVTYKKENIGGFLAKFSPECNLLKTPIVLNAKTKILETDIPTKNEKGEVHLVDMERNLSVDVVINYNPDSEETVRYSFCNDIENIEHGQHSTAVLNAIMTFFRKKVKEATKNNKKEVEVTNNDIIFGLGFVVNMKTEFSRGLFTGQTKHKMDNKLLYEPIRKMTLEALDNYFKMPENNRTLMRIISVIRDNISARLAATKARTKSAVKRKSFVETQLIDGYTAPNLIDKNPDLPFEIYIVEGDSAGTNARTGRYNNDIQGTLGLGGKPSQIYEMDENLIETKAPDIKQFFDDILGCGYGKHFDIDKLIYKKIILGPDADIDGDHIMGIVTADIYRLARPLIENGFVYRVKAPLYRIHEFDKNKKNKDGTPKVDRSNYLYDKDEYFDRYERIVSGKIKIKFSLDDDFVPRNKMVRFLKTNRDYFECLDTVSKHDSIHPDIIEYIAMNPDFRESISDAYPEMVYHPENNSITGSYDREFYDILLDDIFMEKIAYLAKVIRDGNDGVDHYHAFQQLKTKSEPDYIGYLTIGQIMAYCQDELKSMSSRYKGLGEMDPVEMAQLVMNPYNRVLVRMTIGDAEETTRIMDDLFKESHSHVRKKMVDDAEISVDDIDN